MILLSARQKPRQSRLGCKRALRLATEKTRRLLTNGQPPYEIEPLLRVNYHFHWQMSYRLAQPRFLKAGTELQAVAWYDNSAKNPHNPDSNAAVRWGEQTHDEMMVGFFDVAVPASMDKQRFFVRPKN